MSETNYLKQCDEAREIETRAAIFISELKKEAGITALKSRVKVFPEAQFPFWATILATTLCESPDLANLTNGELAKIIKDGNGNGGFDASIISKKLSEMQHRLVSNILQNHGYATDSLKNGTDIKRIVRENVRSASADHDGVICFADGIEIDGKRYSYRQRSTTPTGRAWNDFAIRVAGHDTPVQVILVIRNINIGEFLTRDENAINRATPEELERRSNLNREAKTAKTERLVKKLQLAAAKSQEVMRQREMEAA